jgi:hypothetical protein
VPSTVLIAAADYLPVLKERPDFGDAQVFADTEALKALEAITRQRPAVVALERMFATTSRGAALINRIKADPGLNECEIRIVAHDSDYMRVSARRETPPNGQAAQPAPAPAAVAEAPSSVVEETQPVAPLDQRGTRRAPRFPIVEGIEVQIDGNTATLLDLSVIGAQVVSPTILKPNQRVRISVTDSTRPIRFNGAVAWASFEIPKGSPRYRAGLEFFDADADALTRFIKAHTLAK